METSVILNQHQTPRKPWTAPSLPQPTPEPPELQRLSSNDHTTRATRHTPRRHATAPTTYALSAAWRPFNAYLTENSSSSSDGETSTSQPGHQDAVLHAGSDRPRPNSRARKAKRAPSIASEEESGSDAEYVNVGHVGRKRAGTANDAAGVGAARKRKRAGRLGRADREVIKSGSCGGQVRSGEGGVMGFEGLKRDEVGRLLDCVWLELDWEGVAGRVRLKRDGKGLGDRLGEGLEGQEEDGDSGRVVLDGNGMPFSERLRWHWKEILSRRILRLYKN